MAPSGDAKLLFCSFFIACCCLTVTLAEVPVDCCLSVEQQQQVPKHVVVDYRRQVAGRGCSINATILVTKRLVPLCVPANEQWVEEVVEHVDKLRAHCKKIKYKNQRCNKMMSRN